MIDFIFCTDQADRAIETPTTPTTPTILEHDKQYKIFFVSWILIIQSLTAIQVLAIANQVSQNTWKSEKSWFWLFLWASISTTETDWKYFFSKNITSYVRLFNKKTSSFKSALVVENEVRWISAFFSVLFYLPLLNISHFSWLPDKNFSHARFTPTMNTPTFGYVVDRKIFSIYLNRWNHRNFKFYCITVCHFRLKSLSF